MKNLLIVFAAIAAVAILVFVQRNSLVHNAALTGKSSMMSLGLLAGADVNAIDESGATPLMIAADAGHLEAVQKLIAKKADVNAKHRDNGKTALMLAASRGHGEVVDALLAAGAAVDLRDNADRTAYSYAFENNKFDVAHKVQFVAENKVDLPDKSKEGEGKVKTMVIADPGPPPNPPPLIVPRR
jgi:hypothetical protein